MEVRYKQKMQSKYIKLPNRESVNGELFDTSRLLEKVLARDNMLEAMYKVIRNKGKNKVLSLFFYIIIGLNGYYG